MKTYYRWIPEGSDDLKKAINDKKLTYTNKGKPSNKAFFVFQLGADNYQPRKNVHKNRVLVAITVNQAGEDLIEDENSWVNFEDDPKFGEAKYPNSVIVKNNERGARGIGRLLLQTLSNSNVTKVEQATKKEYAKALGKSEKEIQWKKWQAPKVKKK